MNSFLLHLDNDSLTFLCKPIHFNRFVRGPSTTLRSCLISRKRMVPSQLICVMLGTRELKTSI